MADNVVANPGAGGSTFATDNIGGVNYPRSKMVWGPDGTATDVDTGASALPIADGGNSITVDGTVAVSGNTAVTLAAGAVSAGATSFVKLEDVASASGDAGVPAMAIQLATPTDLAGTDADYAILQMSGGRIWASAKIDTALPAGTNAIGKLASNSSVIIGAVEIAAAQTLGTVTTVSTVTTVTTVTTVSTVTGGGVAHDGADAGNPIKVGGRAINAEIAAVANNDRSDFITDLVGKQIVMPYANPENFVSGAITSAMTGTTSTSLLAAPASGLRNYITQITVSCAHATQGTDILIQDGNGGTTLYVIPAAALYGGAAITFNVPLRQPTTATAIYCANVTTGSSTKVSASGYKGV